MAWIQHGHCAPSPADKPKPASRLRNSARRHYLTARGRKGRERQTERKNESKKCTVTQRHKRHRQTESKQSGAEIKQRSQCAELSQRQTEKQTKETAESCRKSVWHMFLPYLYGLLVRWTDTQHGTIKLYTFNKPISLLHCNCDSMFMLWPVESLFREWLDSFWKFLFPCFVTFKDTEDMRCAVDAIKA